MGTRELRTNRGLFSFAIAVGIAGWLVIGAPSFLLSSVVMADEPAYFPDPRTAVSETARMMRARSWRELARYYDLSGTDITQETLTSGSFFMRDEAPAVGHPGGFGIYKQPFAPGFSYMFHTTAGGDVIEVTVYIEIDQGGGLIQEGRDSFRMRESGRGYRLLPKSVD